MQYNISARPVYINVFLSLRVSPNLYAPIQLRRRRLIAHISQFHWRESPDARATATIWGQGDRQGRPYPVRASSPTSMKANHQDRQTCHVILSEAKDLRRRAIRVPLPQILSEAKDDRRQAYRSMPSLVPHLAACRPAAPLPARPLLRPLPGPLWQSHPG